MAIDWEEDFNPLTIPAVNPKSVRRVVEDGTPTQAQLDWEQAQTAWLRDNTANLNKRITQIREETENSFAAITTESEVRATADEAFASQIVTIEAALDDNAAAIVTETTARVTADSAIASQITTLTANVGANAAAISTEVTARANGDSALASQITTLTTTVNGNTSAISAEVTARTNADSALASSISTLTANTATNIAAAVATETAARTSADTALSGQITTVTATANSATATGQIRFTAKSAPSGTTASYGLYLTASGAFAGFEASAYSGGVAAIGFTANQFRFTDPGTPTPILTYSSGLFTINSNVKINGSLSINSGTVVNDNIAANAATQAGGSSSGTGTASVTITTRAGATVAVIGLFNGAAGSYFPLGTSIGQTSLVRNSTTLNVVNNNFEASGTSTPALAFLGTSVLAVDAPPAGSNTYYIYNTNGGGIGGVTVIAIELAK
jgi:hypothetical protein